MQYMNLGSAGVKVSRICLGMMTYGDKSWRPWVLEGDEARPFVAHAIENGINFFDTADMYSAGVSEQITGRLLREMLPRDEYVLATKVYFPHGDKPNQGGLSRKHIFDAIDKSLKNLGLDYVDLYQIHRFDYETPIEETMEALHDVVKAGKARYIGASSMFAWQFAKMQHTAERHGWTRFVSMQNHYNLVYREEEREMIPLCIDQNVALIPWSPLARGFLAGNRPKDGSGTLRGQTDTFSESYYGTDADYDVLDRLQDIATAHSTSTARIAIAWMLHKRGIVAPIIGASKLKHIDDAIAALGIELSETELQTLEAPYTPKSILGHA